MADPDSPKPKPPKSDLPREDLSESRDGIYRAILAVMTASVIGGALLALFGEYYFHSEAIKNVGVGAVIISGGVYFFFRLLGRHDAKRRAKSGAWRDDDSSRS